MLASLPASAAAKEITVELSTYRAADGVSQAGLREVSLRLAPLLETMPGFVSRQVSMAENGTWTDVVIWASLQAALDAADAFGTFPDGAVFFERVDADSVTVDHSTIVHQSADAGAQN